MKLYHIAFLAASAITVASPAAAIKMRARSTEAALALSLLMSGTLIQAQDPKAIGGSSSIAIKTTSDDPVAVTVESPKRRNPSQTLIDHDAATASIVSSGPFSKVIKNLKIRGTGIRNTPFATADVWAYNHYAYTGTFDRPCGTDENGVWIWDVRNKKKVKFVGIITSPNGSRASDVKVAAMNSGDILVHSNEDCDSGNVPPYVPGRGGFEIYNVNDPTNPVHLASVQTDDVNAFLRDNFTSTDLGVYNVFPFTQGSKDYVAAVVNSDFGNFQIFDITDQRNPSLAGYWGAEQLNQTEVTDWASLDDEAMSQ